MGSITSEHYTTTDLERMTENIINKGAWYAPKKEMNTPPEVLERRKKVAELWNKENLSVQETAERLGVKRSVVSRDRRFLLDMWQMAVEADVVEIVARELERLEAMESELWSAWELSKQDSESETREMVLKGKEQVGVTRVLQKRIGRLPNVGYLSLILKIQERRAKLLGLDKAVTFEQANFSFAMFVEQAYEASQRLHMAAEDAEQAIPKEIPGEVVLEDLKETPLVERSRPEASDVDASE